jgi:hypothetical protein
LHYRPLWLDVRKVLVWKLGLYLAGVSLGFSMAWSQTLSWVRVVVDVLCPAAALFWGWRFFPNEVHAVWKWMQSRTGKSRTESGESAEETEFQADE